MGGGNKGLGDIEPPFIVSEEQLNREGIQLIFEGLDTYADVYLNGSLLLKAVICLWGTLL